MITAVELRTSYHPPVESKKLYIPTFDQGCLQKVVAVLQQPEIVEAMAAAQAPKGVLEGEIGRLRMLSGAFHPDFYHKSIGLLMTAGVIPPDYSMIELGTSLAGHLPQIPENLQPGSFKGVDNKAYVVAGAQQALLEFQKAGLLDSHNYQIILGDHTDLNRVKGDVSILSLASQYDGGVEGTVKWLMSHCKVAGINGDVIHSPVEVSEEELDSGNLPMRSERLPYFGGYTGVNWKLEGSPTDTPFGQVYKASLLLDDAIYNEANGIVQLPQPGAELAGKVTISKKDGRYFAEDWAWELTNQATDQDADYLRAIGTTFNEQYSQLKNATNPPRVWESIAGLAVPVYAAQKLHLQSVVMLNTAASIAKRSGMLPLAMLRRNGEETRQIYEKGLFSQIGPGKVFKDIEELFGVIGSYMSDPQRFFSLVDYTNPLLATSITTRHQDVFKKLQATA